MKEIPQQIGLVSRGTIVQLAKSMCRAKITECESDIRRFKYRNEPDLFKPRDAPPKVQEAAREILRLKKAMRVLESDIHKRGFSVSHAGEIERAYDVRRREEAEARTKRQQRLVAARDLREQTLIALVSVSAQKDAAEILKSLRNKLDAI